ncbi:hypothetical protein [Chitinimonas lacunae]|uniref:Uncharacterized protein n=1 Tax=Chitinimonas lacunae TaxID=1963018 RepID=A0ABV8MNS9_9NEIS
MYKKLPLLLSLGLTCLLPAFAGERTELARSIVDRLVREDGGPYAESVATTLPLPRGMSSGAFVQALQAVWVEGKERVAVSVPEPVRKWGSGGQMAWQFKNAALQGYFPQLFETIRSGMARRGHQVSLGKNDLFHGHIFAFERDGVRDFGILFHAKEYPNDPDFVEQNGGKGTDSDFSTRDRSYKLRNFLWLASASKVWLVRADKPALKPLITSEWLDPNSDDPLLRTLYQLQLRAVTLQDQYFAELGQPLGSINYFKSATIVQLTGQQPSRHPPSDLLYF